MANASGDPAANRPLSQATQQECYSNPTSITCEVDAIGDINAARASEGVAPMILPTNFNNLSVPQQLLVLANLERVARGLIPAGGLSASLNAVAAAGALANADANPGAFNGDVMASNWAGGIGSTLVADYEWMYDDGPGSSNIECRAAGDAGCWGHRDNILYPFDAPLVMGAASVSTSRYDPSMTEVFVGGDLATAAGAADALLSPTWAAISQSLRPLLSATALSLAQGVRTSQLTVTASAQTIDVQAASTSGWQVTPSSCHLAPGTSCQLTVTRTGALGGSGRLTVSSPSGSQSVALSSQGQASLSITTSRTTVKRGSTLVITGHLTALGGPGAAGQQVTLLARSGRQASAAAVSQARTGSGGLVRFRVRPRANTTYVLVYGGSPALGSAGSRATAVRVR